MALDDLASKLADLKAELGNAKIQQMAQQPRQQEQLQGLMQLVDDLMAEVDDLKRGGQQDEQKIMSLEARLTSIEALQAGGASNNGGRETAEIKQVRKNIAGYATAMGRGAVDPATSAKPFPPDSTTTLAADPLFPQEASPGQIVSLAGKNMQRITEVRVDGEPVLIVSMAENEVRFMVPADIDQPQSGSKPTEFDVEVYVGRTEISGGLSVCIEPAPQQGGGMTSVGAKQTGGR